MGKLTLNKLKEGKSWEILFKWTFLDNEWLKKEVRYVWVRWVIEDWAIYQDNEFTENKDIDFLISNWTKIINEKLIKVMSNCTDEALLNYRY